MGWISIARKRHQRLIQYSPSLKTGGAVQFSHYVEPGLSGQESLCRWLFFFRFLLLVSQLLSQLL